MFTCQRCGTGQPRRVSPKRRVVEVRPVHYVGLTEKRDRFGGPSREAVTDESDGFEPVREMDFCDPCAAVMPASPKVVGEPRTVHYKRQEPQRGWRGGDSRDDS